MSAEWAEQPAVPADSQTVPGKALAAQREAMGWTVEQVADQLKLAVRQVVALEAGDYAALPGPAVVRGFIRAYAKVVKLDAAPLVAMVALETPAPSDATSTTVRRDKPASFSEVRFPSNGKRAAPPYGVIAIGVVLLAAAGAAWHFGLLPAALMRSESPAASAPPASASAAAVADKPQLETTLVKPEAELKPLQSASVPLISVPPVAAAGQAQDSAPAASASANALVIEVREDSWVEVRRAKGSPLIARLVKAGSTETFDVSEPVTLVVGKPNSVSATLRGAPVDLPPIAGGTISRVNLK
ncbi:MAG: helix-turn-helix domain-containing protein [Pseudomonadota bacterium]